MSRLLLTVLAILVCLSVCVLASAADLRVETRVYAEDEEQPVCQSVTLFSQGVVYDFREDRPSITIFRSGAPGKPGRFILMDTEREVRTEIMTDKIDGAMANLRRWAAQSKDPFLQFASSPTFTESFDEETGKLQLIGETLSYHLITMPNEQPETKLPVRQFLDNFTKLQTLLETSLPPDPRLRVNEALFRHGVMPVETKLFSGNQEKPSLRAEHLTVWILSKRDLSRIDQAIDHMASFKEVSNEEYRNGQRVAAAK